MLAAYPAGSSFKPFTLAAALKTGVAAPEHAGLVLRAVDLQRLHRSTTTRTTPCGTVSLRQAMAFSCNTTYMPLSIRVLDQADPTALSDAGRASSASASSTGVKHLVEETGILPDAAYFG